MSNRKIVRVDINSKHHVSVEYSENAVTKGGLAVGSEQTDKCNKPAHKSLVEAFEMLIPHLVFASQLFPCENSTDEYLKEWGYAEDPMFTGYHVTGIKLIGKDHDGVKLIGRKETTKGDVVSIVSPIISFDKDADDRYTFVVMLNELIDNLLIEAGRYLKGKYEDTPQTQLVFSKSA